MKRIIIVLLVIILFLTSGCINQSSSEQKQLEMDLKCDIVTAHPFYYLLGIFVTLALLVSLFVDMLSNSAIGVILFTLLLVSTPAALTALGIAALVITTGIVEIAVSGLWFVFMIMSATGWPFGSSKATKGLASMWLFVYIASRLYCSGKADLFGAINKVVDMVMSLEQYINDLIYHTSNYSGGIPSFSFGDFLVIMLWIVIIAISVMVAYALGGNDDEDDRRRPRGR